MNENNFPSRWNCTPAARLRCALATAFLLFVSLAGSLAPAAEGATYSFTNIADSTGVFSGFNEFLDQRRRHRGFPCSPRHVPAGHLHRQRRTNHHHRLEQRCPLQHLLRLSRDQRVGHGRPVGGDGIEFWGQSFIAAPTGEIIAKGSVDKEELVIADIEWKRVDEHRTHWPFLRDRRIDAYSEIQKRMID